MTPRTSPAGLFRLMAKHGLVASDSSPSGHDPEGLRYDFKGGGPILSRLGKTIHARIIGGFHSRAAWEQSTRFFRSGARVELTLAPGQITGVVVIRERTTTVEIEVPTPEPPVWDDFRASIATQPASIPGLICGNIPEAWVTLLTRPQGGVIPQLVGSCACNGSRYGCDHIDLVAHSTAKFFDSHPEQIFRLLGVEIEQLLPDSSNADEPATARTILPDELLPALFGIELYGVEPPSTAPALPEESNEQTTLISRRELDRLAIPTATIDLWIRRGVLRPGSNDSELIVERDGAVLLAVWQARAGLPNRA